MTRNYPPHSNDNDGHLWANDRLRKRVIWPDVIRIVAIFAVIMLHAAAAGFGRFGARTVSWQVCNLYDSFARFCVPVFVMVSGMFLLSPEKEYGLKKLYFTKILRIATAYLFWATFYSMNSWLEALERGETHNGCGFLCIVARGIIRGHYHLWFLFMIGGIYICVPFLRSIAKDDKLIIYFLTLGSIFIYGTNMINLLPPMRELLAINIIRLHMQHIVGFTCYFLLGYWLSKHNLSPIVRTIVYIMGVLSAIGTAVINGLAGYHFNCTGMWMYGYLLPNILLMATAVFVFCQYQFRGEKLPSKWQNRIGLIGRWSFGVYLIHAFFLENLHKVGLPDFFCHPIISIPITTLVVFGVSLAVVFILDRIPILNKYVM